MYHMTEVSHGHVLAKQPERTARMELMVKMEEIQFSRTYMRRMDTYISSFLPASSLVIIAS